MLFLAFLLARMNVVADWFMKMRITEPADGINRLLNYFPLALVVVLFFLVLYVDQALKEARREKSITTRSGIGYDLHRLAEGRKLMIGGVDVPFDKGSVGHSDGDVLAHALCDALLGAAGLGDIGTHFPDTDPKWKGASSLLFLEHTRKLLDERRLRIVHLDAIVICERPKLGPHFPAMRAALAKSLGIAPEQINLKAKTNEGTGEIGRGEAIAAHTIATLEG
jgi:2-C-methyl-D-erythritol 2,4-cyclodiphosphate synthase